MSSSPAVTPQRRSYGQVNTGTASLEDEMRRTGDKRRRISDEDVLPRNFRRSPLSSSRSHDIPLAPQREHQPGSIVRVTLTNFVTYSNAEFFPGPNLNMVIGPNGTGKSTLVCAICIGLGWSTSHLGRAKDIGEFVKHGAKSATIEIELKGDSARHSVNPVISHIISRNGGGQSAAAKSLFMLDGRKTKKEVVQALARSFSIQVDNLCQFLPQDRVVEFAALSPVDLLAQTQRAAAPDYMSEWHEELKSKGKEHRQRVAEQQSMLEEVKKKEDRQRSQEEMVNRLRERNALRDKQAGLEKLRPFAEQAVVWEQYNDARQKRKLLVKELRRLQNEMGPNQQQVDRKKACQHQLEGFIGSKRKMVERLEANARSKHNLYNETSAKVEQASQALEAEKNCGKDARDNRRKMQTAIRETERALQSPPAPFDSQQMNEAMRLKTVEIRGFKIDLRKNSDDLDSLKEQLRQRESIIHDQERKRDGLQSQAGRLKNKLHHISKDSAKAWDWIQANRNQFRGSVHGPPMITCSVKDPGHADAVETVIGRSQLLAFTVTTQEDFDVLQRELYANQKLSDINIRSSLRPLCDWTAPCDEAELKRLGGAAWLVDLIEGPDEVLAMLCDNSNIHATAYSARDLSDEQFNNLRSSPISSFITLKSNYQITRRREYGDAGISTRVTSTKKASLLTDAPVDTQEENEIAKQIMELKDQNVMIREEINGLDVRGGSLRSQIEKLSSEKTEIAKDKAVKQEQETKFRGLTTKLEGYKTKLEEAEEQLRNQSARRMKIIDEQDRLCLEKGQQALDLARAVDALRPLYAQMIEAEIMYLETTSDREQLEARDAEQQRLLEDRRRELGEIKATEERLLEVAHEAAPGLEALKTQLTEDDLQLHQQYVESKEGLRPERLETDIQQVVAQLDMLHAGNENVLREFEDRAKTIERMRNQLRKLEQILERVSVEITEIRERWEPQLDEIVGQISTAFAENFARIHCAGEVGIHKDDDFEQWAIQIRVKFREKEQLSILDSHRQSGGERAVSTIFYLLALQSLARAPFRVVDEINQGMDPRNERLVHSRMVEIACAEHTSQYFLITPKLLSNLRYHENMKVHCIASGEYMPENHRELDFQMLAEKALAIRAA